jgi:hypothetical protein
MFEFANPGFLVAGGALVSSPIIIHLINRLRYKRVRWAAMEFLLKSQKKNRRRLIIEQLILLLLRCLLVVMALWLVARLLKFLDISLGSSEKQKTVHVVILDDSLSLNDWVDDRKRPELTSAFDVAKKVIGQEIGEKVGKSRTPQDLVLIVLSDLAAKKKKYKPTTFTDLRDKASRDKLNKELGRLKCSLMHFPVEKNEPGLRDAVQLAYDMAYNNKDDRIVVHLVSDFRHQDWGPPEAQDLCKTVKDLAILKDADKYKVKVNLIDVADPYRQRAEDAPKHHDNIGIVEFYPETRVAASGTLVRFTIKVHNFSSTVRDVRIALFNPESGAPLQQFETGQTLSISPGQYTTSIEARFDCDRAEDKVTGKEKEVETYRQICAKLEMAGGRNQGVRDGLEVDNVRFAAVLVRPKVPVLVVDGNPKRGRRDGGDYHHIVEALDSAPGSGFEIVPNPEKTGGIEGVDLLSLPNLERFPSIFLLNVATFNPDQLKNLQSYVRNGGSVAFFLGRDVDPIKYNALLYKEDGTGLFPVELSPKYFPPRDEPELKFNPEDTHFKVLLRKDNFPSTDQYPIFGPMFQSKTMEDSFRFLPIRRYFKAQNYKPRRGVLELATMPNEDPVSTYAAAARGIRVKLTTLADDRRFVKYSKALAGYSTLINKALEKDKRGKDKKLYELAEALDHLLHDRGDEGATTEKGAAEAAPARGEVRPNMANFWADNLEFKEEVNRLWMNVRYGSPLVLAKRYGLGRVVVVMTSAGKDWNDWAGGAEPASFTYPPMILEMQSYLTSMGREANLKVGAPLRLDLDSTLYADRIKRHYFRPRLDKDAEAPGLKGGDSGEDFVERDAKTGRRVYVINNAVLPGFYRFDLTLTSSKEDKSRGEVEQRGFVFNVDTMSEGDLRRVSRDTLMKNKLQGAPSENLKLRPPFGWGDSLIDRQTDFSESTWFYLIFLMILIAEQAMAVHLSFHLREGEATLPAQAVRSQAMTAA